MPPYILGVVLHAIGGFAAGSFYAPLKKVQRWSWESSWMVMGVAAWILAPWVVALLTTPKLTQVLAESDGSALFWTYFFGVLWGIGGLTYGLSVRYLGMALGCSVALAFCMVFGAIIPVIHAGKLGQMFSKPSGQCVLLGVVVCLLGIAVCGWAGYRKESEVPTEEVAGREFKLGTGFAVATFAGILSSCMSFAFTAGKPIAELSEKLDTDPLYKNNAVLIVVLIGGFTTNSIWCLVQNYRNKSFGDYVSSTSGRQIFNYVLSTVAGIVWYLQFFFYGMGASELGKLEGDYEASSWAIHMAFIIVFSNLWGVVFREWRGSSGKTKAMVWAGILILIASTIVIAYGRHIQPPE